MSHLDQKFVKIIKMYTDIKKLHEHTAIGAYSLLIINLFIFPESHLAMHYVFITF